MEWLERRYWHRLKTGGTITDIPCSTNTIDISPETLASLEKRFRGDGYFQLSCRRDLPNADSLAVRQLVSKLSVAVRQLVQHGWPPTFVVMYGEPGSQHPRLMSIISLL